MKRLYFMVFFSGVAGLFYEMAWHKYLIILFGSQAKATAMILAVFLGGIAVGYASFGGLTKNKSWNQFRVYAAIEAMMGIWALLFPWLFKAAFMAFSIKGTLPAAIGPLVDIIIACCLIGPPTILMGGTLPVLTQAVRVGISRVSSVHALIYGFNTVGAAFGCLFAGYYLLPNYDLETVVFCAGGLNFAVGSFAYLLYGRSGNQVNSEEQGADTQSAEAECSPALLYTILTVGGLSGFVTLTLQSLFVRLMGLSMGPSEFCFSLTVSIFILGLGFGSLKVSKARNWGLRHLAWIELSTAFGLLGIYLTVDRWPYWLHLLRILVRDTAPAFYLYQAEVAVFFFGILILPIGLAGMVLPLCFHMIKGGGKSLGYRVGQLYSINSFGCVAGALFGGFALLNWLNLDGVFKLCILFVVVSLGLLLWQMHRLQKLRSSSIFGIGGLLTILLFLVWEAPEFDKRNYNQPFRHTEQLTDEFYDHVGFLRAIGALTLADFFYKDGPTSTISISTNTSTGGDKSIYVNGKCDANTAGDYLTMASLAHLAGVLTPENQRSLIVGFGSGISAGVLAQYPTVKVVDVAELSESLIEHASMLDSHNYGASKNQKIQIHNVDAFNFLMNSSDLYDAIVSEPSNPWVMGVENLFSTEFYAKAKKRLKPEGVLVQWLHGYSFTNDLFAMVVKTMMGQFSEVRIFQMTEGDYALVASPSTIRPATILRSAARLAADSHLQDVFAKAGLTSVSGLLALEILPDAGVLLKLNSGTINSVYNPKLSSAAARAFFENRSAEPSKLRREIGGFFRSVESSLLAKLISIDPKTESKILSEVERDMCKEGSQFKQWSFCDELQFYSYHNRISPRTASLPVVVTTVDQVLSGLRALTIKSEWSEEDYSAWLNWLEWYRALYSPIARFDTHVLRQSLQQCLDTTHSNRAVLTKCKVSAAFIRGSFAPSKVSDLVLKVDGHRRL